MADILKLVCGWLGAALALVFFLSPVVPIIKLIKGQVKLNTIPVVMLICNVLNCDLWFSYGLYIKEYPVWVCNGVGGIITSVWIIIYWVFFAELKWIPALIYNLIYVNIIGELYYIVHVIGGHENNHIIGWVAMAINIIMYAAPGVKIINLYKTGNLELIPIYSVSTCVVNSTFWTIYGITINDFTIIVPNVLGIAFSIFQIISWVYVRQREIKKKRLQGDVPKNTEEIKIDLPKTAEEQSKENSRHSKHDQEKVEPVEIKVSSS